MAANPVKFVRGPLPKDLICLICDKLFKNPVQCLEGHIYCKPCYDARVGDREVARCPGRHKLTVADLRPAPEAILNKISNLHVLCTYWAYGCKKTWKLSEDDDNDHSDDCPFWYRMAEQQLGITRSIIWDPDYAVLMAQKLHKMKLMQDKNPLASTFRGPRGFPEPDEASDSEWNDTPFIL